MKTNIINSPQPLAQEFLRFQNLYNNPVKAQREFADFLYKQGKFSEAIWYYVHCIESADKKTQDFNDYSKIAASYYAMRDFEQAVNWSKELNKILPKNPHVLANLGVMLNTLNRHDEAEKYLLQCRKLDPQHISGIDALTRTYYFLKKHDKAKSLGNLSLKVKNNGVFTKENQEKLKQYLGEIPHINCPIKPFDQENPQKNIIAFSLFGSNLKYYEGALFNATLAPFIYPGWTCRFYCEKNIPQKYLTALQQKNVQIILLAPANRAYAQLFWRFLVADDTNIDRYIIRDADSLLNCQERVAVDEWIISNKHFHIMRDHYNHAELILGGMWGGIQGALPPIKPLIQAFLKDNLPERTNDQVFLRNCLWPLVCQSYLAHDDYFNFGETKPFPILGHYPTKKDHIGKDYFWNKSIPPL